VTRTPDAVVIGAGHNGLVAANVLADAGWRVAVVEAEDEPGGSVRSGEVVEPGFLADRRSAFFPLGAASPVFRRLELEIPWRHGPLVLAHPAADGSCPTLARDGGDPRWRRIEPAVLRGLTTPLPQLRAAAQLALEPGALGLLSRPDRLVEGCALHTDAPPRSLVGRALGVVLVQLGRRYGFPCVEGGAGTITRLLVERALARGVELRLGERVSMLPPARRAVVAAVDVWELGRILGRPVHVRPDPPTLKVDWTLDGPVPWRAPAARRSPVVHLGAAGRFAIFGQYSMADPTRAPAGKETAWGYTHDLASADALEDAVERLAPGFRVLVRGRRVESLPPGRISGGTARWTNQLVLRPYLGRPWARSAGVYLGSLSAHPGGGVHGAPGWIAAQAALRSVRSPRRGRSAESFTSSST
jgi:phytoene dehydrogenase-like protein